MVHGIERCSRAWFHVACMCNSRWNRGQACTNTRVNIHALTSHTNSTLKYLPAASCRPLFIEGTGWLNVSCVTLLNETALAMQRLCECVQAFPSITVLKLTPCHNSLQTNVSLIVGSRHCVTVHNVNAHFTFSVMFLSFSVSHTEWLNRGTSTFKCRPQPYVPKSCREVGRPSLRNKESGSGPKLEEFLVLFPSCHCSLLASVSSVETMHIT